MERHNLETCCTAPILTEERDVPKVERRNEVKPPARMGLDSVRVNVDGLVGAAHPDHVRHDDPVSSRSNEGNHLPVQVGPVGLTVQEQDDVAVGGAFVDIVHSQAIGLYIVGLVVEVRQVFETLIRSADEFATVCRRVDRLTHEQISFGSMT